ncbi:E1 ubiquitin-activating protein, partial [Tieghemiomyces parasiticus]
MQKMSSSNVLIIGLKGLGVEVAKNVILAGVKSVTLYDPEPTALPDLSNQFFLREEDVGTPRAQASAARLAELNQYVPVHVLTEELTPEVIRRFKVIVATETPLARMLEINQVTHGAGNCFIATDIRGLFGHVFCDFGPEFLVSDPNGEEPVSGMIAAISREADGVVTCLDETRHGLEDGDFVTFSEVQGMTDLNGGDPRP